AAPPRLVQQQPVRIAGDVHDLLRGSRLARDRDREGAEDAGGGPDRGMRRLVQALLDDRERARIDAARLDDALRVRAEHARSRAVRAGILDVEQYVRGDELAAVRDQFGEA